MSSVEGLSDFSEVIAHYAQTRELLEHIGPSTPRSWEPRCSLQLAFLSASSLQLAFFASAWPTSVFFLSLWLLFIVSPFFSPAHQPCFFSELCFSASSGLHSRDSPLWPFPLYNCLPNLQEWHLREQPQRVKIGYSYAQRNGPQEQNPHRRSSSPLNTCIPVAHRTSWHTQLYDRDLSHSPTEPICTRRVSLA